MIVLLDVDGVIADFTGAALRYLREAHGIRRSRDEVTQYKIGAALGLDERVNRAMFDEFSSAGFCSAIEPLPYARSGVR